MKPKPFASLNHLTVPCCLIRESPFCEHAAGDPELARPFRLLKQSLVAHWTTNGARCPFLFSVCRDLTPASAYRGAAAEPFRIVRLSELSQSPWNHPS